MSIAHLPRVRDLTHEEIELAHRLRAAGPGLARLLLRKLRQAEQDTPADGRLLRLVLALSRDGRPALRGSYVEGPREFVPEDG